MFLSERNIVAVSRPSLGLAWFIPYHWIQKHLKGQRVCCWASWVISLLYSSLLPPVAKRICSWMYLSIAKQQKGVLLQHLWCSTLLEATHGFSWPKGARRAVILPEEQYRETPFNWTLIKEQIIALVIKLEASSLAPILGHLGNGYWKKFNQYALRLVQSPYSVHSSTPSQCKMCFVANMVCWATNTLCRVRTVCKQIFTGWGCCKWRRIL